MDTLRSLFLQIQNLNTEAVESGYIERTLYHLESTFGLLQLLIVNIGQTQDRVLQHFKVILESVLAQSRIILETFVVLEEARALSFTCPTAAG